MTYLYSFANVSLILRVMKRLEQMPQLPMASITVIYLVDRWVMQLQLTQPLGIPAERNLIAFLLENGLAHNASMPMRQTLKALEQGATPTEAMNEYQVVVVSHGEPAPAELHDFCSRFVAGLGYYPPSLV